MRALALALALLAPLAPPHAALADGAARTFAVAKGSTLTYRVIHKFHEVEGRTSAVEGRARLAPDGALQVAVRAPVASFDSGNSNRDGHMMEATEAGRFPFVTLKAVGLLAPQPAAFPATVKATLRGELTFHGVTKPVEIPVEVGFESPGRARVSARVPVSLDAHGVERPSLLFVKVDDLVNVDARLLVEEESAAAAR